MAAPASTAGSLSPPPPTHLSSPSVDSDKVQELLHNSVLKLTYSVITTPSSATTATSTSKSSPARHLAQFNANRQANTAQATASRSLKIRSGSKINYISFTCFVQAHAVRQPLQIVFLQTIYLIWHDLINRSIIPIIIISNSSCYNSSSNDSNINNNNSH